MFLEVGAERLLRETAARGRQTAADTAIILVICVKGITRIRRDHGRHSISTSFYSAQELDDMICAFRALGCYVQHFADEVNFMAWATAGGIAAIGYPNTFVYIGSVNGTGPGRRCLVPSFCSLEGIRTLNSDAYSSAINRHKFHWTRLLGSFGIGVPQSWLYEGGKGWLGDQSPPDGLRVIAKTLHEDSSIGVTTAGVGPWSATLAGHVEDMAGDFAQPIMVQQFIAGSEVEVPVIELGATRIAAPLLLLDQTGASSADDFLSYDVVWDDRYRFTADHSLPATVRERLPRYATQVCQLLNFRYLSRVDFRVDDDGNAYVIDISTTPHLTRHSSYGHLFSGLGLEYTDVMATLIGAGLAADQSSAQY
jgi:D-alanine-D-alanine ligase